MVVQNSCKVNREHAHILQRYIFLTPALKPFWKTQTDCFVGQNLGMNILELGLNSGSNTRSNIGYWLDSSKIWVATSIIGFCCVFRPINTTGDQLAERSNVRGQSSSCQLFVQHLAEQFLLSKLFKVECDLKYNTISLLLGVFKLCKMKFNHYICCELTMTHAII